MELKFNKILKINFDIIIKNILIRAYFILSMLESWDHPFIGAHDCYHTPTTNYNE